MKDRIKIDQFKPKAHPYRAIFRRHKVSDATIANYADTHTSYIANVLAGTYPMSKPLKAKLDPLVQQLLEDEGAAA